MIPDRSFNEVAMDPVSMEKRGVPFPMFVYCVLIPVNHNWNDAPEGSSDGIRCPRVETQ